MSEVKWIKISTNIFDDEKILLIESMPDKYAIITCWFKLLCLAGKQNNSGVFTLNDKLAYTDEMLSTIFRMPLSSVRLALKTFENFGMVETIDGVITIPNWDKHQSLDAYEKKKEYDRQYQAQKRLKQKELVENRTTTRKTVVALDIDKDKEIEEDIDINKENISKRKFSKPSLQDVQDYINEKGYHFNAEDFINHYEAVGWKVGKSPMKDWRACCRTWESNYNKKNPKTQPSGIDMMEYMKDWLDK